MENGYKGWVYTSYVFKFTYINNIYKYRKKIKNRFMTPQEKAKELAIKFSIGGFQQRNDGIQCALIAVDEILYEQNEFIQTKEQYNYWQEVKKEIEKL